MLVYVNGQMLDSNDTDILILGLEGKEKEMLQNLTNEQNTLAFYDGNKHKTEDVRLILNTMKLALKARNKTEK